MTREEAIQALKKEKRTALHENKVAFDMAIKSLEQEPNTWSLDDAREDFISDVYNTLDFLPTNEEAIRIIDSFDRVTSSIKQEPVINKLRTEIESKIKRKPNLNFTIRERDRNDAFLEVLDIIDKYKAESEPQESEGTV